MKTIILLFLLFISGCSHFDREIFLEKRGDSVVVNSNDELTVYQTQDKNIVIIYIGDSK